MQSINSQWAWPRVVMGAYQYEYLVLNVTKSKEMIITRPRANIDAPSPLNDIEREIVDSINIQGSARFVGGGGCLTAIWCLSTPKLTLTPHWSSQTNQKYIATPTLIYHKSTTAHGGSYSSAFSHSPRRWTDRLVAHGVQTQYALGSLRVSNWESMVRLDLSCWSWLEPAS